MLDKTESKFNEWKDNFLSLHDFFKKPVTKMVADIFHATFLTHESTHFVNCVSAFCRKVSTCFKYLLKERETDSLARDTSMSDIEWNLMNGEKHFSFNSWVNIWNEIDMKLYLDTLSSKISMEFYKGPF